MNYFEHEETELTNEELWAMYDAMTDFKNDLDREMIFECELEERI